MAIYEKSKAKAIISERSKIKKIVSESISDMAAIVGATLGPGGRSVIIERDGQFPICTKDGVTVAKSLGMGNAEKNIIIESAKEICLNTAKDAGDGTTTAIVLADAIIKHGSDFIQDNPKYNPQRVVNELQELYKTVVIPHLKSVAIDAATEKDLIDVATISANGDSDIAKVVVEAVSSSGDDGTVLIEEDQGSTMRVETIDGYVITTGLKELGQIGPIFINDRKSQQCSMENGIVFLYDGALTDLKPLSYMQDILEGTQDYGSPMIIMAHEFSDIVLDKMAKTMKGGISVLPVKTPRSGAANSRTMFLRDMAAYTGATVHDPGDIENVEQASIGHFKSARSNLYETFLICEPDMDLINARVEELKGIESTCFAEFDRMFVRAAIGKLTGGISTIWVGGMTDLEIREKKARVEDAVEAVRSAISEGIIPGGCKIHLDLIKIIRKSNNRKDSWVIMEKALMAPFTMLMSNCGEEPEDVYALLSKEGNEEYIFDAYSHSKVKPFEAGIIEPAKVCRVSLGNALSVASLLMTLGGIVVVPRDVGLENQLELSKQAFQNMMSAQEQ